MTAAPHLPGAAGDAARLIERRLGLEDLDRVVAVHDALHQSASVPGLFVRETPAFFAWHLGPGGQILGLETPGGTLVCYSVLGLPEGNAEENFGVELGLSAIERARVCHLDGTGVLPGWRGLGLQRRMTRQRLARGAQAGREIALSTVAPHNAWSVANLVREGLRVVALVEKYGAPRLVLRRDLGENSVPGGPDAPPDAPCVPLLGRDREHRARLADGWEGVALRWEGNAARLVYLPPCCGPTR